MQIENLLQKYGELHVTLDSGDEFHLHKHDVDVNAGGYVIVNSKLGEWRFQTSSVEHVEIPHSHKEK